MTGSTSSARPFDRVLVANRGEIAVRIIRTLRRLAISPIAVHSDADAGALHVAMADRSVNIGPAPARDSYLRVDRIIEAALATGAQAVHPGYGFLAEQPALAQACADAGIVFVGPPVAAIEAMADKIAAKLTVAAAGVPVVPGRLATGMGDDDLVAAALEVGLPVLVKPSAGGGGKGMHLVHAEEDLAAAISAARREALAAFGDDTLLVERFIQRPRHIEIQVLADQHGNVVHLGERECSLQRRHQKIVEEAPSPFIGDEVRSALGATAVAAARACGYVGAGTVEFIMSGDDPDQFFFLEMNTRLQVEHPVTEMTWGLDLVEQQLRVAAGDTLAERQEDLHACGHAVEARIYAEQPARGFAPTGGTVLDVVLPVGSDLRIDSGIAPGTVVSGHYDPMLAKVIAVGQTRELALHRLAAALGDIVIAGVETNTAFLRRLVDHPDVRAGALDTDLVARSLPELIGDATPPVASLAAATLAPLVDASRRDDPWTAAVGWRHGRRSWTTLRWDVAGGGTHAVAARLLPASDSGLFGTPTWELRVDGSADTVVAALAPRPLPDGPVQGDAPAGLVPRTWLTLTVQGSTESVLVHHHGDTTWVTVDGETWALRRHDPTRDALRGGTDGPSHGALRSPMPGTVLSVLDVGTEVTAGRLVAVIEAMKMEHHLRAPFDGRVVAAPVRPGQQVALDELIAELEEAGQ